MHRSSIASVRSTPPAALLALLIVAGLPASRAQADPPCVTPEGTIYSSAASADGTLRTFTGDVTPFGPISGGLQLQINMDGTFTGQFALKGRGGTAHGTISGYYTDRSSSQLTYMETLTFTGGTGRYGRISGSADVSGILNLADGTAVDTVTGGQVCR
jgi:hypothetical protein